MLKAPQIRAARALLGWSGKALVARSGLSIETLRHMEREDGTRSVLATSLEAVESAAQEAGVEFLPAGMPLFGSGVGARLGDMITSSGPSRSLRQLEPEQIRAARALLDWSARELAERSGVSTGTISRLEGSLGLPATLGRSFAVQRVLEEAGIEFVMSGVPLAPGGIGVRLRAGHQLHDHGQGNALHGGMLRLTG